MPPPGKGISLAFAMPLLSLRFHAEGQSDRQNKSDNRSVKHQLQD